VYYRKAAVIKGNGNMTVSFKATGDILEVTVTGNFTAADADTGHEHINDLLKTHAKIKILCNLVNNDKLERSGLLEDMKVNSSFSDKIVKMAIVDKEGHHKVLDSMMKLVPIVGFNAKIFRDDQLDEARAWLG
jgi:hypothetical protein